MPDTIPPAGPAAAPPALVDAALRWLAEQEDYALGCECANPALQIECWAQDLAALAQPR
jgi:hypothetical protein